MVLSLIYGKKYLSPRIGTIDLDVTITEQHSYTSRVTSYPVENGTIVSDHIINDPETLTLQAIVTDTPLNALAIENRSTDVFNRLIDLQKNRELVEVVTGIKVYSSMAITSIEVPRNTATGQSLTFTINMQKVVLDTTVRVQINNDQAFGGPQNPISREQVANDDAYAVLATDPPNSLKDQASSGISAGLQSLIPIPPASLPRIIEVGALIALGFA